MFQQTIVIGNVGKEPEMRYTPSGVPVTSFSLATSEKWTDSTGEKREKTTWFRVTAWRKIAEVVAEYVHKGDKLMVEGTIDVSAYLDKNGKPAASLELTCKTMKMLGSKGDKREEPKSSAGGPEEVGDYGDDSDIPF